MSSPKLLLTSLVFFLLTACSKKDVPTTVQPPPTSTNTFTNPILTNGADPWVTQKDNNYYYTHTTGISILLWKTNAMSQVSYANPVTVWTKPSSGPNSENVWAPELHYLDGKWYIYYTAGAKVDQSLQRLFVLENSSADPTTGTWVDRGQIVVPNSDFWAIDATILDYNGSRYMVWSGRTSDVDLTQSLYVAKMQNPWTVSTSRTLISSPTLQWERIGSPPAVNEGPEILKNAAGQVFLVFSASGCWTDDYSMGMMSLKTGGDPLVPSDWVKVNTPVFVKNPDKGAYGPGHCAFFKSPDGKEDWFVYHANSLANQGCGNVRNPRMQKFTWNTDGTPNFGTPVQINTPITKPAGE